MLVHDQPATRIALVNNMPDGAFDATELQFLDLLRAGSRAAFDVRLHTLPGIERGAATQASIDRRYRPLDDLWGDPPDALIVTGTEPRAEHLTSEQYWPALERLVTWAEHETVSTLLSCLAAHAALYVFDDIERQLLAQKCSGLFENEVVHPHPLMQGLGRRLVVPHSRLNDVPAAALEAAGYTPLLCSRGAGWAVAVKRRRRCLFVLCQGHLEYGADTLLREYRRDVRRFLASERATYPELPVDYVEPETAAHLMALRDAAINERTRDAPIEFPYEQVASGLSNPWRLAAQRFYANWLHYVAAQSRPVRSRERVWS